MIDMKERLCDRMNLRDETFDKIKISVVPDEAAVPIYMDDGRHFLTHSFLRSKLANTNSRGCPL